MVDGRKIELGETQETDFTLQDCVRPILYAMALMEHGNAVSKHVSCEPSGAHFNEL